MGSARRRGLATWALGRMPGEARRLALDRVLIVCAVDNVASAKTIEHHGGILEEIRDTEWGRRSRSHQRRCYAEEECLGAGAPGRSM
jgi:predicted acetyltransferase